MNLPLRRWYLTIYFCVLLSTGLVLINFNLTYPTAAEADPYAYVETAQSFIAGDGFIYSNTVMTLWPPLYPVMIGIFHLFNGHGTIMESVRLLHILIYSGIIFASGYLLWKLIYDERIRVAALLTVAISPTLHFNAYVVMTELVFVLLALIFFMLIEMNADFRFLAVCIALLTLLRYVGVIFIIVGCYWGYRKHWSLQQFIIFIIYSSVPILAWILFHNLPQGYFFGPRSSGAWVFDDYLGLFRIVLTWVLQVVTICFMVFTAWGICRWPASFKFRPKNNEIIEVMGLFVILYFMVNLLTGNISELQTLPQRILGGMAGVFIILVSRLFEKFFIVRL